jgi:hypothetical protein
VNWATSAAVYAWAPLVAVLFASLPPARAVIASYLIGWLFLPVVWLEVFSFDFTKNYAVPLVVFAGVLAFDPRRLRRFRASWVDLPIAIFCISPMLSSISNDLGAHDALSALLYQTISWGLPYFTGRLYFSSAQGLKQLAIGILAGALIYVPLCWFEIRMSPQLHSMLYGFHQHNFGQTLRGGGYRPMVFMHHGLMLGLWMTSACIVGLVLWRSGAVRKLWGLPLSFAVPVLLVTTLFCKSFGALALLVIGAGALWLTRGLRTALPMAVLVCAPPAYVAARVAGSWSGADVVSVVSQVDSDRGQSLAFRIDAEEKLRVKASERPVFGWGGWGRSFVRRFEDARRTDTVITDSLWIIVFGKYGFVGLVSLLASFVVPIVVLWRRCPPRAWAHPDAACAWALATVLLLYALDSLVNAMVNPIYFVIAGAFCGLARSRARAPVPRVAPRTFSPAAAG